MKPPTSQSRNILFIMTDQQRFDAISCHGGWIRTPSLDQFASQAFDFRQHFSQAPVCVPSRSSIFTGRYVGSHRVMENDARLAAHEVHLFKALKQAGYFLAYSGKNHLLPHGEMERNLDRYDEGHGREGVSDDRLRYLQLEKAASERLATVGSYASCEFHDFPDEVTTTGIIANNGIEFLRQAPADQPWCTVISFHDPHAPHLAPRRFQASYPEADLPLPAFDTTHYAQKHPRMTVKHRAQNAHQASEAERRHYLAVYGSMCSFVDEQIGHILDALDEREDRDNTIVVFISDHGDFGWNQGLCKKDLQLYDDLLHVPAILRLPGQECGHSIHHTFTEHVDLVPTLLELCAVEVPHGCQGTSLLPLFENPDSLHKEEIHAEVCYPWMRSGFSSYEAFYQAWLEAREKGLPLGNSAPFNIPGDYTKCVRTRDWKYIWYGDGFEELYHLTTDRKETTNLASEDAYQGILDELRGRLLVWTTHNADPKSPKDESTQLAAYDAWDSRPQDPRS